MIQAVLFSLAAFLPCRVLSHGDDGGFLEVVEWLKANGATANAGLSSGFFNLGGASVRGLQTTDELSDKTTFLSIPPRLWLLPSHFPKFANAELPSKCRHTAKPHGLKFAAALAAEVAKGNSSFYYTYLKLLPSAADFHSFLPRMMDAPLQSDFAALPLVTSVQDSQADDKGTQECFAQWVKPSLSPARGLTWEQVHLALNWIHTRGFTIMQNFGTMDMIALIPAADMINTARPGDLNVQWSFSDTEYTMQTDSSVASGTELRDFYCHSDDSEGSCDNNEMMKHWGVYVEDNPVPVLGNAEVCAGEQGRHMKQLTEDALQDPASITSGWLSPRCRSSTLSQQQGPLRCSLARLAWETCVKLWRQEPEPNAALFSTARQHEQLRAFRGTQP